MEEGEESRYWCHMCSQVVNPVRREIETIKCPFCQSGFVEEMTSATAPGNDAPLNFGLGGLDPDRALSLWAPILLGMMGNTRRSRLMRLEFEDNDDVDDYENHHQHNNGEMDVDQQLESMMRRRSRRNSARILHRIGGIRVGMISEPGNSEIGQQSREMDHDRDGERVVLINPFNQTTFRGSFDPNNDSQNHAPMGSLGDYFLGPGLDLLLQHLADNDPNRYGTPPAQKEAVEALATVKNDEIFPCSVCLEDCEIGTDLKEMPCRHKFHKGCVLPWLELHSSCPICRYQLPCDESKIDSDMSRNNNVNGSNENESGSNDGVGGDESNDNWRRFSLPLPWPFNSLFSSSTTSQSGSGNSSFSSSRSSGAPPGSSRPDEN